MERVKQPVGQNKISVVVPVRNEEENVQEFTERIRGVLDKTAFPWQVIFVEDSSTDRTVELIQDICAKDKRFCAVFLTRSFGHHQALSAGIDFADGDHIILMDGDLQHPPELIPTLLKHYSQGYDMVYAKRRGREEGVIKHLGSRILNLVLNFLSDYPIDLNTSVFRIFSRRLADTLSLMRERNRFLTGMLSWPGFETKEVIFDEHSRKRGQTKYSFAQLVEQGITAAISFTTKPLKLGIYLGLLSATLSFFIGAYYIVRFFLIGIPVQGFTSIIVAIFLVGGVILVVLGIIGEYIGNIFIEVKARPLYVVQRTLNIERGGE